MGLNHVATASTCARRVCLLCLHPVTPSGVVLYRSARGAPHRRPESPRAGQSEVTSPPCAVEVGQPFAADPWKPPRHCISVYNIHCHKYSGESQAPPASFLHYLSRFLVPGRLQRRCAPSARSFRPATLPARPCRLHSGGSDGRATRTRTAPAAVLGPAGSVSCANAPGAGGASGRPVDVCASIGRDRARPVDPRAGCAAQVDVGRCSSG